MIGVPGTPGAIGWGLLLAGLFVVVLAAGFFRRRAGRGAVGGKDAALFCLIVTAAAVPYLVWRFAEDIRYTTQLDAYEARSAGPIEAYLPGYLADGAARYVPRNATYAVVVGAGIEWPQAKAAFPALVQQALFPRHSAAKPRDADYVVTWGVRPEAAVRVKTVWTVHRRFGSYPAVFVGQVTR